MLRTFMMVLGIIFLLLAAYFLDFVASTVILVGASLTKFFDVTFAWTKPMRAVAVTVFGTLIAGLILATIFLLMSGLRGEEED